MLVTHFEAIMAALAAIAAILAVIVTALRWIYRQGAGQQKLSSAVVANTEATGKLTAAYEKSSEKTDVMLLDHEKRITRLEDRSGP